MYDAVAWYLAAINVEEVWASGITGAGVTVLISDDGVDATLGERRPRQPDGFAKGDVNSNSWGEDSCIVESDYDYYYYYYYDARRLEDACPFSSDVYDTPCADQGSKRERNSQLQRLISRPVSTRADAACAGADFSRAGTLGEACKEAVVAYCSEGLKFEHDRDACLDLDRYYVVCSHNQIDAAGQDALKAGVADGRGGKGIVYVFAAGNEYTGNGNTNFEGYLNSRYVMTVGAVGVDLLHASYSSTGASVFVSAPGGDQGDVRGMVTANPVASGTSCGDATGIIATTSKLPDDDGDLPRSVNAAGIGHSYQYGGVVDAAAAPRRARTWTNYGQEAVLTAMASPGLGIADDGAAVHGHAFAPTPKPTLAPVAAPTPKPVAAPEPTPEPTPKPTLKPVAAPEPAPEPEPDTLAPPTPPADEEEEHHDDHDGHGHDEDDHGDELDEAEHAAVDCVAANCPEGFDTEYYSYSYLGDDDWFDGTCGSVEGALDFTFLCQSADATCGECQSAVRAYSELLWETQAAAVGLDCDLDCPAYGAAAEDTHDDHDGHDHGDAAPGVRRRRQDRRRAALAAAALL
ncbi:serine-type endopeptidase [Aureococcus anophagefferens]|nr:serine-type endopeptidase [Aureococcus anophagefferens]